MRCYVCDYCDTEKFSLYKFSVVDPKGAKHRRVLFDEKTQKEICTYCYVPPEVNKV